MSREVDRTPKPCNHKQARHQHGTRACYVLDRCRCIPCRDANREAERARTRAHLYGRWNGYVDATPAREHVQSLQAQGMGWKRIAHAAGVPTGTMWKLIYGVPSTGRPPSERIRPDTEAKILAVRLDLADGAVVPSVGTARRIQALVAVGWSMSKIAARLGIERGNFTPIANGTRAVVASTEKAVRDLYDELWDVAPPQDTHRDRIAYSRALNHARARGWAPPLAWDDGALDDPQATPDMGSPARTARRGRPMEDVIEDIEFLLDDEPLMTAQRIAERLHVDRTTIQQVCRRAGRQDLTDTLARNALLAKESVA